MNSSIDKKSNVNLSKIVPILLSLMIFSLVVDNSFKIISPDLVEYFGVSASTISWQVTLAGLALGIAATVYSALSDSISIRNLLVTGIILMCVGSLLGYITHNNYWLIVLSRMIQATGYGATETLYLIFIAKYASAESQTKYIGYSTSGFQLATVIGTLTGGFIATYLQWQNLFLVPLLSLVFVPFILKHLPKEERKQSKLDVLGIILVAVTAASIMLYMSNFSWGFFTLFILSVLTFLFYISKNKNAFISIEFFKNKQFLFILLIGFMIYSLQSAYALNTLSFLMTDIYHIKLDAISLMFIPASLSAALIGALSGKIGKFLSSKQCIYLGVSFILVSLLLGVFFIDKSIAVFVVSLILLSSSFGLIYAPMIETSIKNIPDEKKGTAIGFYNLVAVGIGFTVGFSYSSILIDKKDLQFGFLSFVTDDPTALNYSSILIIFAAIALLALFLFWLLVGRKLDNTINKRKEVA
ncbi:MFS transporter [Bacillus cereus]|uniref:MFS transporter n=1 Tax=Bacillus cereus TaxID=1396 RepID=UPI002ADEF702|nr:MFS transporter [Bacillus cereus]MEA1012700.1 MFS transporter [Bacillus cereus]